MIENIDPETLSRMGTSENGAQTEKKKAFKNVDGIHIMGACANDSYQCSVNVFEPFAVDWKVLCVKRDEFNTLLFFQSFPGVKSILYHKISFLLL